MIGAAATTTVVALVYRNAIGSAVVAKSKTVASFTSSFMTKTSAVLASVTATGLGASLKSSGNKASVAIKA
jgi:hypothetical protein